jgi:hypothetical protein
MVETANKNDPSRIITTNNPLLPFLCRLGDEWVGAQQDAHECFREIFTELQRVDRALISKENC